MARSLRLLSAIFVSFAVGSVAFAESTKVIVTVEKPSPAVHEMGKSPFHGKRPAVDVAILLDTSNSMDGLIHQAKSQLWTIVQQFAKAKKHGQTPLTARGAVRVWQHGSAGLRRLHPPGRAAHRQSRQALGIAVRPHDQRRRRILRPGHRCRRQKSRLVEGAERLQGDLHRRQRAVHAGAGRLQGRLQTGDRARCRGQHDPLRQRRRRPPGHVAGRAPGSPKASRSTSTRIEPSCRSNARRMRSSSGSIPS